jgi:signal peptidase I
MAINRRADARRNITDDGRRHWIAEWTVNILVFLFGTTTVLQAFVVPSGSMEGTMLVGDHLFVDRLAYSPSGPISKHLLPYQDVRRGDIIVFKYPLDLRQMYVKRAIGIPGDRIHIKNKVVHVNGKAVMEPYKVLVPQQASFYLNNFPQTPDILIDRRGLAMLRKHVIDGELIVPEGHYFAMGDNRDNSEDSRFWGLVPRENIIGQPTIIWWSYDAPTEHLSDGNIHFEHLADMALHFFTKTRWDRTFRLLHSYPLQ